MAKGKKSRDSGAPRGSQIVDGKAIHTETQQKLFFQTHLCTINRQTLSPGVAFSAVDAENFMHKSLKKRQTHATGNILEDRITIEKNKPSGKQPFRSWVGYNEIVAIQKSRKKPEFFVLSVDSINGPNYYEVYKCKTKEDAYKFEKFIKQAMEDPDKRIHDGPAIGVTTVSEDPDLRRSMVQIDFQTSQDSSDEDNRISSVYQNTSPTPPGGMVTPSPPPQPRRISPEPIPQVVYQPVVRTEAPRPVTPPRRSPSPLPTRSIEGLNNVTYIKYDPRTHQPREGHDGPIYMYLQRHRASEPGMRKYASTDLSYSRYNDSYYADNQAY